MKEYVFPQDETVFDPHGSFDSIIRKGGLTKHQLFTGLSLTGLLANPARRYNSFEELIDEAKGIADLVLEEEKEE